MFHSFYTRTNTLNHKAEMVQTAAAIAITITIVGIPRPVYRCNSLEYKVKTQDKGCAVKGLVV